MPASAPLPDGYADEIRDALARGAAPIALEELIAQLRLQKRERAAFDAALAQLQRSGEVVQNRAGHLLVAHKLDLIPGRVIGHPDGHGYLAPDAGGPDLFIPAQEMRQVLHGDRAAVRIAGNDQRGRPMAEIVEVLERAHRKIVGRLHSEHGVLFVAPDDRRIAQDVLVPPADAGRAKAGQIVTVELVAQPSKHAQPIGRALQRHADGAMQRHVIGVAGDALVVEGDDHVGPDAAESSSWNLSSGRVRIARCVSRIAHNLSQS